MKNDSNLIGSFDADAYVKRYPDVEKAGLKPLEHFQKIGSCLGRNGGSLTESERGAAVNSVVSSDNPTDKCAHKNETKGPNILLEREGLVDVYIACWLRNRESIHDGLIELSISLRALGVRAVFITHAQPLIECPDIESRSFTFSITQNNYDCATKAEVNPDWLEEIVAVEQRWLESAGRASLLADIEGVRKKISAGYTFWKNEFEKTRPKMIIAWGSTSPLSRLHLKLCHDLAIPSMVIERGHFSKTLFLDICGQFAYASMNMLPQSAMLIDKTYERGEVVHLIDWIRACDEVPYASRNLSMIADERLEHAKRAGRRVVLLIGSNDLGSGIGYESGDTTERHSFMFTSTKQAFHHIRSVLALVDAEALLVFKPHPGDRYPYEQEGGENLIVARDGNINDLISATDISVSLTTTASARCIVEEKPVVLLSLSDISMKGIAYECHSITDIPVMLRAALDRDGFESRRKKGYAFLAYLFKERLIGISAESPASVKIKDLADFIARRIEVFLGPERRFVAGTGIGLAVSKARPKISIIIPVYGDEPATRTCIESVLRSKAKVEFNVLLLCDASPYPDVVSLMEEYEGRPGVTVLYNEHNIGFSGTVNRGIQHANNDDVIILNSDALVPRGWVDRLQETAYSRGDIATVTPLSNNASIFSVPFPRGQALENPEKDVERFDGLAQTNVAGVEVPVGHGFCMYIKRLCVNRIGYLDEIRFGKGYSEEVDFCLRARKLGLKHFCATNVYVGHLGGLSFGTKGNDLKIKNREIIKREYPEYFSEIREFNDVDPLQSYRVNILR